MARATARRDTSAVPPIAVTPASVIFRFISGSRIAFIVAAPICCTISGGVRPGTITPHQNDISNGTPASRDVGTFGRPGSRCGAKTASAFTVPALMCDFAEGSAPGITSMWPALSDLIAAIDEVQSYRASSSGR